MRHLMVVTLAAVLAGAPLGAQALASGCYTCGPGTKGSCKYYCKFKGDDTKKARQKCVAKGCKISGVAPCPKKGNPKVCWSPAPARPEATIPASSVVQKSRPQFLRPTQGACRQSTFTNRTK